MFAKKWHPAILLFGLEIINLIFYYYHVLFIFICCFFYQIKKFLNFFCKIPYFLFWWIKTSFFLLLSWTTAAFSVGRLIGFFFPFWHFFHFKMAYYCPFGGPYYWRAFVLVQFHLLVHLKVTDQFFYPWSVKATCQIATMLSRVSILCFCEFKVVVFAIGLAVYLNVFTATCSIPILIWSTSLKNPSFICFLLPSIGTLHQPYFFYYIRSL